MKQFLRYLFVVAAVLMVAVGDVFGECYVLDEQPSGYTINIYKSKSYDNISGPCATLSFKARRGIGINGLEVYEYVNGAKGEVKKITNSELKTSWQSYSYSLSRNATKVEFYNNGGIWKEIKEVKITQATYLDPPTQNGNVLKDNSISFGEDIYGNEAYVDVKLNWSNISSLNYSFTRNDNSQFSAQVIGGDASTCSYGTATVRVTYKRTNVNTHTATLVISSGSLSHTINLSGKTGEFTVLAKKKIDLLMNSTYAPSDVFDVYYMKGGEKVIISDYTIIPLTSQLADYVDGQIQTNYRTGNASFVLSRIAKESCKALNETIFVEVKQSEAICYLIENKSTSANHQTGQNEEGTYSETYTLNGIGDKLSFKCKLNRDPDFYHYLTPQYSTTDSGNDFQDFPDSKISTDNGNEHVRSGLNIPLETKRIRFKRTAATAGTANFSIYEIYVSRKKDFSAPTTLTLPQATIGRPVSASFDLNWSTCSDEIVLLSTNSNFVLSKSSIDATSGRGTTTITVTYDANSGSQSGTIIIYDQSQKIEIPVSCEVKVKLATEIIYTGDATYPDTPEGIPYPFYVEDKNGNTVQGAAITLETSNEDILSFDASKIYPHCGGYVTLTATYAGDDTHEPCSLSKTIFVIECYQHIVWNQDLRGFLTDDNGTINETVELTAYAATESGVKTGTPVVYSLDTEAEKIAKLIDNHNGTYSLNVFGKGEGTITASISEYTFDGEQYYPNDYTRIIRVHASGDPCEPYSLVDSLEYAISCTNTTKILSLVGLPENSMSIMAHAAVSSYVNDLTVDFSTEETGDNWIEQQKQNIHSGSENKKYTFTVPENAKRVRFRTGSTLNTYFHNIFIRQKTYLTPSVTEININSTVNQEYTSSFEVEYSNMPHVQYSITNNHNLGLSISPRNEDINTFCNENGTIRFTITGISLIPHEALTETLTITTAAGEQIPILITINAKLLETYSFDKRDGNWSDPANWTVNGSTPSTLPTASNPIVISQNVIVDNQAVAYGIEMQEGGYINIPSTSGLTVHAGGYTTSSQEPDLEITIDKEHAGYFRMYPNSLRTKSLAAMPQAQVNFKTRGNMNNGGNKDATWQYIGAPGSGVGMDLAHTTVLYLRSEEKGWVRQYTEWAQLTPFAGYALTQKEQETFTLYPQLLNENITISLTYTEEGMEGDNLWANSYAAPLDITKFSPGDFTGNVDYTFYLYNSGSWNDWSKDQSATNDANVYTPGRYYAINLAQIDATKDQTVIPPMQGVYMKAGEGGGTLTINYEKHVWNNTQTAKMNTPLRVAGKEGESHTQSLDFQRVRLQVNSENSGADRMYIIQDSMATAGYDNGYDAPKLMADGLVNIYTNEPFGKMEISSTDHMDGMYIGFEAGEDSEYAMTFTSLLGDSLYLYDSQQDLIIEMVNDEQYHFIAEPYSVNDFRFQIMVAPELSEEDNNNQGGVTTNVDNISTPSVWVNQGKLYVTNSQENSTIAIYTASGMLVAAPYTIKHTPCTINIAHLPAGVYVLRLNDQAYKFICE